MLVGGSGLAKSSLPISAGMSPMKSTTCHMHCCNDLRGSDWKELFSLQAQRGCFNELYLSYSSLYSLLSDELYLNMDEKGRCTVTYGNIRVEIDQNLLWNTKGKRCRATQIVSW